MTIGTRTAGAWKAGSTSLASIALPASIAAGDMMVMFVGCKPYNATIATPTGWTKLAYGSGANGTTGSGTDSGSVQWAIFFKEEDGNATSPTVSITSGNTALACINGFTRTAGESWILDASRGSDTSSGTGFSLTMAADVGIASGDYVFTGSVIAGDNSTFGTPTITATGATIGTVTESPATEGTTTTGNDLEASCSYASCTAGTSSAAAVVGWTLSVAQTGGGALVRLREGGDPLAAAVTCSSSQLDPLWGSTTCLLHCDEEVDIASVLYPVETTGVPGQTNVSQIGGTLQNTYAKFGKAYSFTGVQYDCLYVNNNSSAYVFGADDFTVECWARMDSLPSPSNRWELISCGPRPDTGVYTGNFGVTLYSSTADPTSVVATAWVRLSTSGSLTVDSAALNLSTGVWRHYALVRYGAYLKLFIDGTLVANQGFTTGESVVAIDTGDYLKFGADDGWYMRFPGQFDEIRITKAARYTAAFTPPTAAFEGLLTSTLTSPTTHALAATPASVSTLSGDIREKAWLTAAATCAAAADLSTGARLSTIPYEVYEYPPSGAYSTYYGYRTGIWVDSDGSHVPTFVGRYFADDQDYALSTNLYTVGSTYWNFSRSDTWYNVVWMHGYLWALVSPVPTNGATESTYISKRLNSEMGFNYTALMPVTARWSGLALGGPGGDTMVAIPMYISAALTTRYWISNNKGLDWYEHALPETGFGSVIWFNGLFILVGFDKLNFYTSPTGLTGSWTSRSLSTRLDPTLKIVKDKLFALGDVAYWGGSFYTTDGVNWTASPAFRGIAYAPGIYHDRYFSTNGTKVITSIDGISWTERSWPNVSLRGACMYNPISDDFTAIHGVEIIGGYVQGNAHLRFEPVLSGDTTAFCRAVATATLFTPTQAIEAAAACVASTSLIGAAQFVAKDHSAGVTIVGEYIPYSVSGTRYGFSHTHSYGDNHLSVAWDSVSLIRVGFVSTTGNMATGPYTLPNTAYAQESYTELYNLCAGPNGFVYFNGTTISHSVDGVSWATVHTATSPITAMKYLNGKYLGWRQLSGSGFFVYSSNGTTWTESTLGGVAGEIVLNLWFVEGWWFELRYDSYYVANLLYSRYDSGGLPGSSSVTGWQSSPSDRTYDVWYVDGKYVLRHASQLYYKTMSSGALPDFYTGVVQHTTAMAVLRYVAVQTGYLVGTNWNSPYRLGISINGLDWTFTGPSFSEAHTLTSVLPNSNNLLFTHQSGLYNRKIRIIRGTRCTHSQGTLDQLPTTIAGRCVSDPYITGTLSTSSAHALAGALAAVATLTGALPPQAALAAAVSASSTASSTISTPEIYAHVHVVSTAGAYLRIPIFFSAAVDARAATTSSLTCLIQLAGASAGEGIAAAALTTKIKLATAAAGLSAVTGDLTRGDLLASVPASLSTAAAGLSAEIRMAGGLHSTFSCIALLSRPWIDPENVPSNEEVSCKPTTSRVTTGVKSWRAYQRTA